MATKSGAFPPVRACIFDVDGLLINSEDIYTELTDKILHSFGKPSMPWKVKAKTQSTGREGAEYLLNWAGLDISVEEWKGRMAAEFSAFQNCQLLPGVSTLLTKLSVQSDPTVHLAIASSSTRAAFHTKTSHLPVIATSVRLENCTFGDDPEVGDARKKPEPDIFLIALAKINMSLSTGEKAIRPEECLVFEDSIAGVEAGRRAGMRVIWVPHIGLRELCLGREGAVLLGKDWVDDETHKSLQGSLSEEGKAYRLKDGWAEMLPSLEVFDYGRYDIQLKS